MSPIVVVAPETLLLAAGEACTMNVRNPTGRCQIFVPASPRGAEIQLLIAQKNLVRDACPLRAEMPVL